jgi:hypothetical protein
MRSQLKLGIMMMSLFGAATNAAELPGVDPYPEAL